MTNTVRTKVAKTAKSELRFCLFVILLFLLPQLVSARNEDLQTQTLTASTITSDPDTLVITPPGGTTQALALSPELPIEMEPVQLMNEILTELTTKPSTEIQTYNSAATFAKWKHHFADTDSDTQLMDLLQGIYNEVSLKHTGIEQEPYSAPVNNNHTNHL